MLLWIRKNTIKRDSKIIRLKFAQKFILNHDRIHIEFDFFPLERYSRSNLSKTLDVMH